MSRENDGFEYRRGLLERLLRPIYSVINYFVAWHRLPTLLGAVNLSVFRDWLRQFCLHHTGYGLPAAAIGCQAVLSRLRRVRPAECRFPCRRRGR
jgi:hypothetical protein